MEHGESQWAQWDMIVIFFGKPLENEFVKAH